MPDILPDILGYGLKVVFCGTAPSKKSAAAGAYYANPRNRFWSILHESGFIDGLTNAEQMKAEQYASLKAKGYGLTDLCKLAFGNDDELKSGSFDPKRLAEAIRVYQPRFLGFTSRNAGRALCGPKVDYGWQANVHNTRVYVLPTTSPRHGENWWSPKKQHWHSFADQVRSLDEIPGE